MLAEIGPVGDGTELAMYVTLAEIGVVGDSVTLAEVGPQSEVEFPCFRFPYVTLE